MPGATAARISLDDLLAFNGELKALARIGIPLDRGLRIMAGDARGRKKQLLLSVGESLQRGEDPARALDPAATGIPPYYAAIVLAGIRSGSLPAALESVASSGRRLAQVQRSARLILWYPLFVVGLAYLCFLLSLFLVTPRIVDLLSEPARPATRWLSFLEWLSQNFVQWACIPPLILVVLGLAGWRTYSRAPSMSGGRLRSIGSMGRLKSINALVTFIEVLAMLVEHGVALPEALNLAASATNHRRLTAEAKSWASDISQGSLPNPSHHRQMIPSRLYWTVSSGSSSSQLATNLRRLAQRYQREAENLADWLSSYLPILLTVGIGGTAVIVYALVIFLPWCFALWRLGEFSFGKV